MPDETSARLWDLRALCEEMLRDLSTAQRCLEAYRDAQPKALERLRAQMSIVRRETEQLAADALATDEHLDELLASYTRPSRNEPGDA